MPAYKKIQTKKGPRCQKMTRNGPRFTKMANCSKRACKWAENPRSGRLRCVCKTKSGKKHFGPINQCGLQDYARNFW